MADRPTSFDKEALIECGKHGYAGPGTAQLPVPPMLMMDRITSIGTDGGKYNKGHVVAELDINPDLWFFQCHFPNDPVMPGCLGLDAMWQLVGFFMTWGGSKGHGRALGAGQIKFSGQVQPTVKLVRYEIDIRRAMRGRLVLGIADGRMYADGEPIYEAQDLRVGLFEMDQLQQGAL
ncbi:bifunctional 3-hydroxydecanoyl-ACP dehydratase/trans-2-decenoyl-ACP isomerase [Parvularcula sp. LCG005]|uniref:bifunctional 3-hydroxydecanoyl-ACP dehydratase/trans-2-decenoyl-ACP isomerase n=1 Tax=Parvularcula sp. LCG005 TaxID=3078805 RepID=UPI0029435797|nr:bifunctional 3-hydroxydecanoyl-ACP dehydratase/trans-2-decenoyl-ACP isomerase [Parvularcula sp. LCG005]WOI54830.1 bifunctional 3-hydroxydecanoyl-ACP dehydratase/trans-2-decenoyl-ACP isomerase [Parvularcula sp. LCG005]